jgi:hypothetical protein
MDALHETGVGDWATAAADMPATMMTLESVR